MEPGLKDIQALFPRLRLPEFGSQRTIDTTRQVFVLTNGDLRPEANLNCWPVQEQFERKLADVLQQKFSITPVRAHPVKADQGHGFIGSQREGCDVFQAIHPDMPLIVLLTAWQYSHHLAPSLVHHRGPVLILANFDGTWPGLVGALNLAGTLTGLGRSYSRLWSENFDDDSFIEKLGEWLNTGNIIHDTSYLKKMQSDTALLETPAGKLGRYLGEYILHRKEIIGLFDTFCMGMINGVFPQKTLCDIGMPMEGLSQSMLVYEMSRVPGNLRESCLQYYLDRGMRFRFGPDPAVDLTRDQVMEQCAMLIAMARVTQRFGLSCVGVQYQQGLKDVCPASDFAEGAIGSTDRYPIPDEDGRIIRPGQPIPCANEVDMGSAIPQTMLFRLLSTLGLPAETTLHDIRWGSEYQGTFYWDFEISGNVPFEHLKGGIAGAIGYRQPPMYFANGGATISGQGKAGAFIWARAHYDGLKAHMHVGTGRAVELPQDEFHRRLQSTTDVWPLMNATLDGVGRNDLMAGHQSNHITVAYVPEAHLDTVVNAFVCMALTQNMNVYLAGNAGTHDG